MGRFTIYTKDGAVRHESVTLFNNDGKQVWADSLDYSGAWMAECFVTITVKSPYPIDFHTGDYIDYRGERFTLNYDPTVVKKARRGTYGEGFTYDSIKFNARHTELTDIKFLDIVLYDNELHYTALPDFPFYAASIDDYCDRLQACTNQWCAANGFDGSDYWIFITPSYSRTIQRAQTVAGLEDVARRLYIEAYGSTEEPSVDISEEKRDVSVTVSNQSIWDSLALIKSGFGLNFINRGRACIIGSAGIATEHVFKYGKGNGLYEIERVADTEQKITTKLYAYGSGKNLPVRYYANTTAVCHGTITGMVMGVTIQGVSGNGWMTDIPWKDALFPVLGRNKVASVGVKFAGGSLSGKEATPIAFPYSVDSGAEMVTLMLPDTLGGNPNIGDVLIFTSNVSKDSWPPAKKSYDTELPNNMSVSKLMLPGFPEQSLYEWVKANGGTGTDDATGKATWRGYTAYFSKERYRPYILSLNYTELGVREDTVIFDGSDDTEEIYPTVEGTGLDVLAGASMVEDNGIFEDGEDTPTVELTLPDFGRDFHLDEYINSGTQDGDSPAVSMRDGYCGARTFSIRSATKNADGTWKVVCEREYDDLLQLYFPYSDGVSRGGTAQADEPYQVRTGDKYVLTGIPMTSTYIEANAVKLLEASLKTLAKNDYTRYTYMPRVDEVYMARQHEAVMDGKSSSVYGTVSLHDTLKEGNIMLFEDADLGIEGQVFIDTLQIKENGNNGIPTYEVTLRNDKQVGTIQRIQDKIDSLVNTVVASGGGNGMSASQLRAYILSYGRDLFLSKTDADTAAGLITFLAGLVSKGDASIEGDAIVGGKLDVDGFTRLVGGLQIGRQFVPGLLGEGGVFRTEADGTTYMEADKLYVRMKAFFDTVEIRKYLHSAGNRVASVAGAKCIRVEYIKADGSVTDDASEAVLFRCFFRATDGDDIITNDFQVGDQVYCHVTNAESDSSLYQHHYWRLAVGVDAEPNENGEHWIDLSNRETETLTIGGKAYTHAGYQPGSDVPVAQDDITQLGHVSDITRQGAIVEMVGGSDAPSYQIYQGINDFTLTGRSYITLGYSTATGRAYMNVYGDTYIGDPDGSTYVKYDQQKKELEIKAKITAQSTIDGQSIDDYIKAHQDKGWTETEINNLIAAGITGKADAADVEKALEDIQKQVDGAIETWYYEGAPTLDNAPASLWNTKALRDQHLGDLYYDKKTGYAYRFMLDGDTYKWTRIQDDDIAKALGEAEDAYDLADGKRRIFVSQPKPPYDEGDMWVNATYPTDGSTYKNDILRCEEAKAEGESFAIGDWTLASKYTDDSALANFINNTYNGFVTDIKTQVDGKAETWYQSTDPSTTWNTPTLKAQHVGDIWMDTSANGGNKTYIYRNTGTQSSPDYKWVEQKVPTEVFDKIDGKADIFVSMPATYNKYDLWIIESSLAASDMPDGCQAGDIVISNNDRTNNYTKGDWKKRDRYTDDSALKAFQADEYVQALTGGTITQNITNAQNTANAANSLAGTANAAASAAQSTANEAKTAAGTAQSTADQAVADAANAAAAAAAYEYLKQALAKGNSTEIEGGLVLSTLIALRDSSGNTWSGINGAYQTAEKGPGYMGHGIASWYGGKMVDHEASPGATDYAKSLFRFDGSGYLAGGNITWDKDGKVTIANVYADVNGISTELSGTLQDLTKLSNALPLSTIDSTVYLDPKYSFTNLSVKGRNVVTGLQSSSTDLMWYENGEAKYLTVPYAGIAGKLNTARNLWGRSFDGSADVSGDMTGVGDIYMNTGKGIYMQMNTGQQKVLHSDGATYLTIGLGTARYQQAHTYLYGSGITLRYAYEGSVQDAMSITSTGVGIGTTAPAYKLDVNGTARVTSLVIGNIQITADSDGLHVNNAGLYADTYLSALGKNTASSGGSGDGLTWNDLADAGDEQISGNHLTTALANYATRATTLAGYGITNGVTTVRVDNLTTPTKTQAVVGMTISGHLLTVTRREFLTSHQSLSHLLPLAGGTMTGVLKFASGGALGTLDDDLDIYGEDVTIEADNYLTLKDNYANISLSQIATQSWVTNKGYVTTDTKNTAGATDTSAKIFLIGATAQNANPQTYSHDTVYVGTDGCLYSGGAKVLTSIGSVAWSGVTGKPTTLSGYGITDGVNDTEYVGADDNSVDTAITDIGVSGHNLTYRTRQFLTYALTSASVSGSGNAITSASVSGGALTLTKGTTFLTSHQGVSNKAATLSWGATSTIATIGAVDITLKMPSNPNTNTWRGIQDNLTSTSTTESLSANQGRILNNKFASYLPLTGGSLSGGLSIGPDEFEPLGLRHDSKDYKAYIGGGGNLDLTVYANDLSLSAEDGLYLSGNTIHVNNTLTFKGLSGANALNLLYAPMADNDQFRIRVGGTASNAGWAEIATADDGTEPIYVRQYTGVFSTVARTLTLLDGSGNTSIPGQLYVSGNVGIATSANTSYRVNVNGAIYASGQVYSNGAAVLTSHQSLSGYLPLSGGTMTAPISKAGTSVSWFQGRNTTIIKTTSYSGYNALVSMKTTNGSWDLGVYTNDTAYLTYITDSNYNANQNTITYQLSFPKDTGTIALTKNIPTNTNQLTNGAGFLTSHQSLSHLLPLAGGTMTGNLTIKRQTYSSNTYTDSNPKIIFRNVDGSQNISLTFTDYDAVVSPASLTLNGNQGGEYFIAPNIKATSQFVSSVATGTAPLKVTSTTAVANLNADMLDGYHASSFLTSHQSLSNYVTLNSSQTISGNKTFSGYIYTASDKGIYMSSSNGSLSMIYGNDSVLVIGYSYNQKSTRIFGSPVSIYSNRTIVVSFYSTEATFSVAAKGPSWSNTSDARQKDIEATEIEGLTVDAVAGAPTVRFRWNSNLGIAQMVGRRGVGTLAQYWQRLLPEAVTADGDGYLSMSYGTTALLAAIVTARKVTEHARHLNDHERRIAMLEAENRQLRSEIDELKGKEAA